MNLTLVLHRTLGKARSQTDIEVLEEIFSFICNHYPTVFPGEEVSRKSTVTLTFDDAFCDFFYLVFPLLKKYQLKAVVAPIVSLIQQKSTLTPFERLESLKAFESLEKTKPVKDIYCSFDELQEMIASKHVKVANHTFSHQKLIKNCDLEKELIISKKILEDNLQIAVDTLIYPLGYYDKQVHEFASKHYQYIFRIGTALNRSWAHKNKLYYRVCADGAQDISIFSQQKFFSYWLKSIVNYLKMS